MTQTNNPNFSKLPELCYAVMDCNPPGSRVVILKRGESGYFKTDYDQPTFETEHLKTFVEQMNQRLEVTPAQQEAMIAGSMFGWHVPGANPEFYETH